MILLINSRWGYTHIEGSRPNRPVCRIVYAEPEQRVDGLPEGPCADEFQGKAICPKCLAGDPEVLHRLQMESRKPRSEVFISHRENIEDGLLKRFRGQ